MAYEFRERSKTDKPETVVFSIAYDMAQQKSPVRLEASREYVEDVWELNWRNRDAVINRMDAEKLAYLKKCEAVGLADYNGIGVVRIG